MILMSMIINNSVAIAVNMKTLLFKFLQLLEFGAIGKLELGFNKAQFNAPPAGTC